MNHIYFNDSNSRDTYFTLHNVKSAHSVTLGKGVKVGVIDWLFSYGDNPSLYAGYADISGKPECLNQSGHGFWMANTLREISPDCKIYAINAVEYGDYANCIGLFENAIDWSINNGIEILTYSHATFDGDDKPRAHAVIEKAANAGIITTFIHCDSPYNIWPYGCFPFWQSGNFDRTPDVNILHFDSNVLRMEVYERFRAITSAGQSVQSGDDVPFFSFSSMSPVLGGFIALMKERNKDLSADECRMILIETSFSITEQGRNWYDLNPCNRVVDIGKAVASI